MDIKTRKVIPAPVGLRLLGPNATWADWNNLVACRVIEVAVTTSKRGSHQQTDFASLERAARKLAS